MRIPQFFLENDTYHVFHIVVYRTVSPSRLPAPAVTVVHISQLETIWYTIWFFRPTVMFKYSQYIYICISINFRYVFTKIF